MRGLVALLMLIQLNDRTHTDIQVYRKAVYMLLDCSRSIAPGDFEAYKKTIRERVANAGDKEILALALVGDYRNGLVVFRTETPREKGLGFLKMEAWKRETVPALEKILAALKPLSEYTDLLTPLHDASAFFENLRAGEMDVYYFTDGFLSLKDLDFESKDFRPEEIVKILKTHGDIPTVRGATVIFVGVGGHSRNGNISFHENMAFMHRVERTKIFWRRYFEEAGSPDVRFIPVVP